MNKNIIIGLVLILSLVIVWLILLSVATNRECPDALSEQYYYCERSEDCYFHPKYECINYRPLDCFISEDLSAKQQAQSLLECVCTGNECVTQVKR